jgi:hypothetical protein
MNSVKIKSDFSFLILFSSKKIIPLLHETNLSDFQVRSDGKFLISFMKVEDGIHVAL